MKQDTLTLLEKFSNFPSLINDASYMHGSVFSGLENGQIQFRPSNSSESKLIKAHKSPISKLQLSPNLCLLSSCGLDGCLRLWNVSGGQSPSELFSKSLNSPLRALAFSPDSASLLAGASDGSAKVFSVPSGREKALLRGHTGWVTAAGLAADRALTGGADRQLLLWDLEKKVPISAVKDHSAALRAALVCGETLVSAASDGYVKVYDSRLQRAVLSLRSHGGAVISADFSGDSLVTSGSDFKIALVDLKGGRVRGCLDLGTSNAVSVKFLPGENKILAVLDDRTVRLYEHKAGIDLGGASTSEGKAYTGQGEAIEGNEAENEEEILHRTLDGVMGQIGVVTRRVKEISARIAENERQVWQLTQFVKQDMECND